MRPGLIRRNGTSAARRLRCRAGFSCGLSVAAPATELID
jgi:hypothetical protein